MCMVSLQDSGIRTQSCLLCNDIYKKKEKKDSFKPKIGGVPGSGRYLN